MSMMMQFAQSLGSGGIGDQITLDVQTTGADEAFTLPLFDGEIYNFEVEWGDGQQDTITAGDQADLAHTYANPGTHRIVITGTCPRIYFNNAGDKGKVVAVLSYGAIFTSLENAFRGCSNCVEHNVDALSPDLTSARWAWYNNAPTSFDTSALGGVQDFTYAWSYNNFASFDSVGMTGALNITNAWYPNSSLTSFDARGLTAATKTSGAWRDTPLTSFDASSLVSVTTAANAWQDCQSLATFTLGTDGLKLATDVSNAWAGCGSLTSFDASNLIAVTDAEGSWSGCSLDQASVDAIIDVFADNIKSPGFAIGLDGGTNSPPSAAAINRIDTELTPAGYTVSYNI